MFNADTNWTAGQPVLTDVAFIDNLAMEAVYGGGGMFNGASNPILTRVTFDGNQSNYGGGIYNYTNSDPVLIDVTFKGNKAFSNKYEHSGDGGGICCVTSYSKLINVIFDGNTAAGNGGGMVLMEGGSGVTFTNVIFTGNTAGSNGGGISILTQSGLKLTNVTFTGNQAGANGGGMYIDGDSGLILTNATITSNRAGASGGGIYNETMGSSTQIRNSILWGNTLNGSAAVPGAQVSNATGSIPIFTHSLVQGAFISDSWDGNLGLDGGSNLDDDPLFIDAAGGDLRLQPDSPGIDAGSKDFLPADGDDLDGDGNKAETLPLDLDKNDRVRGLTVDLGAYEYQAPSILIFLPVVCRR